MNNGLHEIDEKLSYPEIKIIEEPFSFDPPSVERDGEFDRCCGSGKI